MVKHIAFTMYPVKDMARARKFYEKGLGLKMTKNYDDAWVEYHLSGACFAITTMAKAVKPATNRGGSIAFEVKGVDAAVSKLRKHGAKQLVKAFDTPVCRMAILKDSEGNALMVHAKK
jgi:predicted enzyme related to lactoylglutathione lyase